MEDPAPFTYRNLRPLFPGNFAKSSTLYTYPAWTFGGRKFDDETTDGPGPVYPGERWQSWNSKSYKFGGGNTRPKRQDATGGYTNYDNDTISGRKLIGGWDRATDKAKGATPGPADYQQGDGWPTRKPFLFAPGWGPPPKAPLPQVNPPLHPDPGFEPPRETRRGVRTAPANPSKYPPMPKVTPGPADYDVTKQYKYGDPYGKVTFKGRHARGKGNNNPSANHYFVHQTTLGAANRRFHDEEPEPFSTYCTHFYDSMKRSTAMRESMPASGRKQPFR